MIESRGVDWYAPEQTRADTWRISRQRARRKGSFVFAIP